MIGTIRSYQGSSDGSRGGGIRDCTGVFSSQDKREVTYATDTNARFDNIYSTMDFSAQRASEIFGNSTTVQPAGLYAQMLIRYE